jgi:ubiquinone/menaquinone biosynthesis C-methylase UbiE
MSNTEAEITESSDLLAAVRNHWEQEPCGTRYGRDNDEDAVDFELMANERYRLEPYIPEFANFESGNGKQVLEIGVGGGVDFLSWLKSGAQATGIDLTEAGVRATKEQLQSAGFPEDSYSLTTGNAEGLSFEDGRFDIVYSYGVLHHTPNTNKAFSEACRVLKKGGVLKAMVYHVPSVTGWLLWIRYCFLTGKWSKSPRSAIYDHLESPGTKAYTIAEMRAMLEEIGVSDIKLTPKLVFGDLLLNKPSKKYQSPIYSLVWRLYPRWLIRMLGDKYGLFLFVEVTK